VFRSARLQAAGVSLYWPTAPSVRRGQRVLETFPSILPRSRRPPGARFEVRRRFFLFGASSWSSVLLPQFSDSERYPPQYWWKPEEAVEMPVRGKHGETMELFFHPYHSPWKSLRRFPHYHRRDYDKHEYLSKPVKTKTRRNDAQYHYPGGPNQMVKVGHAGIASSSCTNLPVAP